MDNSQSEQDQKEELASLYSDITKSIYGVRLSIDPNDYTLEELQAELDALDGREYIYKDEEEHYSLLDSYEEEQKAREPGEHTHDFFDTMDFKKDKAKLRNTSSFRENKKTKMKTITKSQLRQMIRQAVLQEQLGSDFGVEDPGILIDEIEDGLKDVKMQLSEEAKGLISKIDFLSLMIRALDSTDFGGSVEHGPGMANPHGTLEDGARKLARLFSSYGHGDLADKINKLLDMTL